MSCGSLISKIRSTRFSFSFHFTKWHISWIRPAHMKRSPKYFFDTLDAIQKLVIKNGKFRLVHRRNVSALSLQNPISLVLYKPGICSNETSFNRNTSFSSILLWSKKRQIRLQQIHLYYFYNLASLHSQTGSTNTWNFDPTHEYFLSFFLFRIRGSILT